MSDKAYHRVHVSNIGKNTFHYFMVVSTSVPNPRDSKRTGAILLFGVASSYFCTNGNRIPDGTSVHAGIHDPAPLEFNHSRSDAG